MYKTCSFSEDTEQSDEPPPTLVLEQVCPEKCSVDLCKDNLQIKTRWDDWKWQIKNRIRTLDQLIRYLPTLHNSQNLADVIKKYPLAITPYYASLIQKPDTSDPIFQLCVPQPEELFSPSCLSEDPLEENEDMPVPGLVHRYPDRALVIVTTTCASYCRHCTRKRMAGTREVSISTRRLQQVTDYLLAHPEISDVIISGGDPLTMPTDAIEAVLSSIRSVKSVQVIRIGTRVPVVLPMRITAELVEMLRKYQPLWINAHFNHPNELTPESADACNRLADGGIPLGNQTVLLRGVNDSPRIIEQLCRGLVRIRVRPYYLYQCDLVQGVEHFRTPLSRGIEIIEYMRGRVSGIAIPSFVVDAPHGGGKIPIMPNYIVSMSPTHTVLRNYEGLMVNYPEPEIKTLPKPREEQVQSLKAGVWELASGRTSIIQPANMVRNERRRKNVEKRKKTPTPDGGFLSDL
ncbi:MAG: KamA family radical SAM protein [Candidatus Brocadiia bacterium]|nr:MAG: KamA family radical SAM protein [Candidatus Brocadiia bacterium]